MNDKTALYVIPKDEKQTFSGILSDSVKVTENCIIYNMNGINKRIKKENVLLWTIKPNINRAQHESNCNKINAMLNDVQYDYGLQSWTDGEEMITGDDVLEMMQDIIK